jgi:hypothetical protein
MLVGQDQGRWRSSLSSGALVNTSEFVTTGIEKQLARRFSHPKRVILNEASHSERSESF